MKSLTSLVALLLLVSLFSGCSKKPILKEPTLDSWSLNSTIDINPRFPIDPLYSGMTVQDIIAKFGQPTRTNAAGLEFSGFGLFICPDKGEFTLSPPFAGRTTEGIGLGSSRIDVIKAYGEPTVKKTTGTGFELLSYDLLGIKFQLHDGSVDWIDVISKKK